ncbi:MAG: GHMP family kinase ATP-binding protein [Promethearchaeota archaeon]
MNGSRAKAPVRVSFGGGGTDMEPYCSEHGGAVVSTTISKYVYVSAYMLENDRDEVVVNSVDLNRVDKFPVGHYYYDGRSDLVKSVLKHFNVDIPLNVVIHSDLPPGSGMGTSSSLVVALIAAISRVVGVKLDTGQVALLAYKLEREELGQRGGYQDQYAAAFGGFNYITFGERVEVHPLELSRSFLDEFHYRLLLVYTGRTHLSSEVQDQVMQGYTLHKKTFLEGMAELVKVANGMRDILATNDTNRLEEFARLLHEGWLAKKSLSEKITTSEVEKIYLVARREGALGGKLLGAGGGGHVLLFVDPSRRVSLVEKLRCLGGEIVQFEFEPTGVRAWDF